MHLPDTIEHLPTDALVPYARNSRTHSLEQIGKVADSIRRFGFTNPILVRGDTIIAGHGRVMAAKALDMATVPVIRLDHLTEDEARAYVIADNKLAELAGWDDDLLAIELRDLQAHDFDLGLTGFTDAEVNELLFVEPEGKTDADAAPAVQEVAITQPGDVWQLGKHRLMCGDSTESKVVEILLAGVVPHLMVTDPPYGVEYDPEWRNERGIKNCENNSKGKVLNDNRSDWREAWLLFPGDVAYVWHSDRFSPGVAESLIACGFDLRALVIWGKEQGVIGRGHYHFQHEPCWYAVRKGATGHWQGDRKQTTLWSINKSNRKDTGHGTQKPVECMRRPIENNSAIGDAVYEPFSGSGTTIIAAEQTGRRCYAMELSPNYVDVAVRRWQTFTGQRATHAITGAPFPG